MDRSTISGSDPRTASVPDDDAPPPPPPEAEAPAPSPSGPPTFTKDIAPIVFQNCAPCHRTGESAPFALLTYDDVARRAKQIAQVTRRRYMPPWPPERGYGEFVGERRLTAQQIARIQQWVTEGAPEGKPSDLPPPPRFTEGWQLGKPDLVVSMPRPYALAAGGTDVFRNFVIPLPIDGTRFVKTVEFRPGNPRIVHHATMLLDPTASSRTRDEQDEGPGFGGMFPGEAKFADGQFLGWVPNSAPYHGTDGLAFRVDKGTDVVIQMHMRPTGKAETLQSSLGFFLSEKPPTKNALIVTLASESIDIAPGAKDYTIRDTYVLPTDIEVLALLPHAHYLGKEIRGYARLPDGTSKWLIYIKDWDFNWQGVYRYVRPVPLPKGTRLTMRIAYDNSEENVRNPSTPPRRVLYGPESSDEMGQIEMQVVARNGEDLAVLKRDLEQKALLRKIAGLEHALEVDPANHEKHHSLALNYVEIDRIDDAIGHLRTAARLEPDYTEAHHMLGALLAYRGDQSGAEREYREAIRINTKFGPAYYSLGNLLAMQGKPAQAAEQYERAIAITPDSALAHYSLGSAYFAQGRLDDAARRLQEAIRLNPDFPTALLALGQVLARQGKPSEAAESYQRAIRARPDFAGAYVALGNLLFGQGRLAEAADQYERALQIKPDLPEASQNLTRVRAALQQNR